MVGLQARALVAWRHFSASQAASASLFVWALAEATVWPVVADFLLAATAAGSRRPKILPAVAGMAVAGAAGYEFAYRSPDQAYRVLSRLPMVQVQQVERVRTWLRRYGLKAFLFQPYSGVPMKVWSVAAGYEHMPPARAVPVFVAARAMRMTSVALVANALSRRFRSLLERNFLLVACLYLAGCFIGWARVVVSRPRQ